MGVSFVKGSKIMSNIRVIRLDFRIFLEVS